MPLDHKPLGQLDEADLRDLVENAVAEGTTLDFKAALPGNADEDKREFLRDVSSFANTLGGHLVYGMVEEAGVARAVSGIEIQDAEAEKLRLENMLRDGLAPRLPQVDLHLVALPEGNAVLIMRVARSWQRPHMVTFRNLSQFWARNSAGKYLLSVDQIRSAVMAGPATAERIRAFRAERIADVVAGNLPYPVAEGQKLLLQLVPVDAFDDGRVLLNLAPLKEDNRLRPLYSDYFPVRWNLDGLYADDHWNSPEAGTTVQLHRTGLLEAVDVRLLKQGNFDDGILGYPFERTLMDYIEIQLRVLRDAGAALPIAVLVTLVGLEGYWVVPLDPGTEPWDRREYGGGPSFDRDVIPLPDVLIDDWDADVRVTMRPVMDAFWQAAGKDGSPNYDENGIWQRRA